MDNDFKIEALLNELQELESLKIQDSNTIGKINKVKEQIGDINADKIVRIKFGDQILGELFIPARGKGAVILDRVYELKNGDIVVLEAKFNKSQLGSTNQIIFGLDDAEGIGDAVKLSLKDEVEQFSGEWLQQRIKEIRKYNHRLANKLENAWQQGKIKCLVIRTKPVINSSGNVSLTSSVVDKTADINEFKRTGRKVNTLTERGLLKRKDAKEVAFKTKYHKTGKPAKRKSNTSKQKRPATNSIRLLTEGNLSVASPANLPNSNTTPPNQKGFNTNSRMTSKNFDTPLNRGTNPKNVSGIQLIKPKQLVLQSTGKVVKIGITILKAVKTIGRIAFKIFVPLRISDFVIEVALMAFDSWERKKRMEQEEWKRIINFLLSNTKVTQDLKSDHAQSFENYIEGFGSYFQEKINGLINDEMYNQNIMYWLNQWNTNQKYAGFVYATLNCRIAREVAYLIVPEENIKYYLLDDQVSFTDITFGNRKELLEIETYKANERPNHFFKPDSFVSMAYTVDSLQLNITYIIPYPILTPFDFLLFKCSNLYLEIINYLSKYDNWLRMLVINKGNFIPEDFPNFFNIEDYKFSSPIDNNSVKASFAILLWYIQILKDHHSYKGKNHRKIILNSLINRPIGTKHHPWWESINKFSPQTGLLGKLHLAVNNLVSDLNPIHQSDQSNTELDYLTYDHLMYLFNDLKMDFNKILIALNDEDKYMAYEYRGTFGS